MRYLILVLTAILCMAINSCSSIDESLVQEQGKVYNELDTITFKINLDGHVNTRVSGKPDPQVLSDYMGFNKSQDVKDWENITIEPTSEYNDDVMLKAIIYDTEQDNAITLFPQSKRWTSLNFYWDYSEQIRTFNFTLPRNINKSKLKINIGLIQQPWHGKSNIFKYQSSLNQYENITMSPAQEFKDSLNKRYGYNGAFNINNNGNQYKDAIYIGSPVTSFYKSQNLFDKDNNLIQEINLERLSSYVIVLTDEFNQYDPDFELKLTSNAILKIGKYPQSFDFWNLATLDYKPNRKIFDYVGSYTIDKWNTSSPLLLEDSLNVRSYDISIINEYNKKQYNVIDNKQIDAGGTTNDGPLSQNSIKNIDVPISFYSKKWHWIKHKPSNRIFLPVASRVITMPYGRPRTLETRISSVETHFEGDETNKEIKYLVCNVFTISTNDLSTVSVVNPYANKWFRFVYEIPEDGLKPNCLYIIRNKPGTKLFKEWDESSSTTRAGDEDFTIDSSILEIEEIHM